MGVPNTFTNGSPGVDADEINANFTWTGMVPVGAVIAWLKSYTNTPALDDRFVECNGQTLSDAGSVYNGQTIPNLNASGGGDKRFLRGSTTSGTTGGSETHNHTGNTGYSSPAGGTAGSGNVAEIHRHSISSDSSLPSYYEVVWIMRVK
jgi:hypothetical protein